MNQNLYDKRVALTIKIIRELKKVKQLVVANDLCLDQSVYSRIEKGEISISVGQLNIICKALRINIFLFITITETDLNNIKANEVPKPLLDMLKENRSDIKDHFSIDDYKNIIIILSNRHEH